MLGRCGMTVELARGPNEDGIRMGRDEMGWDGRDVEDFGTRGERRGRRGGSRERIRLVWRGEWETFVAEEIRNIQIQKEHKRPRPVSGFQRCRCRCSAGDLFEVSTQVRVQVPGCQETADWLDGWMERRRRRRRRRRKSKWW